MNYKYDVFISYSRKDTIVADAICRSMDKAGISYFIDRQGIGGGMEFPLVLAKAIRESELFLFLGSRNSYCSKFTINEITYAFNKKERNKILPYIIDSSSLPEDLEFVFAGINWRILANHPIETVLISDLLDLLGRKSMSVEERLLEQGKKLYEQEQYVEAVELFRIVANQGNAEAQCELARCYWGGDGVKQDWYETVKWMKMSADQKFSKAQMFLGRLFEDTDILDIEQGKAFLKKQYGIVDPSLEAFKLFQEAASQGNTNAMIELAYCYERGIGVEQNDNETFRWYKMASEKDPSCLYYVGKCYQKGIGVEKNANEAIKIWEKAVDEGFLNSAIEIGKCYYYGNGICQNFNEAFRWFQKSAEEEWNDAPYYIGECYYSGNGVERNMSEAIKWWEIAAEHVDPRAMARLRKFGIQTSI